MRLCGNSRMFSGIEFHTIVAVNWKALHVRMVHVINQPTLLLSDSEADKQLVRNDRIDARIALLLHTDHTWACEDSTPL